MARNPSTHEDFSRDNGVRAGSEKAFGMVFAAVFAIVGFWPLIDGEAVRLWSVALAGLLLFLALVLSRTLRPLNAIWFRFGLFLHKIVNPLVMAVIYFSTVVPIALVFRLLGKDPLHRRFDPAAPTYWIERHPPGPNPDSMRHQF